MEINNHKATATLTNSVVKGGCPTDSTCTNVINANPMLGPLQDNGGATQTMLLGAGSSALDAGNDSVCNAAPVNGLDQRGIVRPQGSHCDIGAVEVVTLIFRDSFDAP